MNWKKKKTRYVFFSILLIAFGAALLLINRHASSEDSATDSHYANREGAMYKQDLLNMIQAADKITVTEHSDLVDYLPIHQSTDGYKERTYAVVELDANAALHFLEIISELDEKTQDAFPGCVPEPHHRIEFYAKGKKLSTMDVCLTCGQIDWKGETHTPPESVYQGMSNFVKSLGLHPKMDWTARLRGKK